ncbi:ABC transporter substrate-binding protein [Arcobacter sp. FWKO B]|uniref:ABC transporter substrate-binding protein n=1 Tax=Arcobacter sp. FWKO B TaxID=2593672 RepID=UPI0018A472DC|nr:helical backbone metal receptor [Arcobacter sp. FWKO B]QOG12472.1 ABC transporter substrate-binding protein [Arcobacter sp. FWKO B]
MLLRFLCLLLFTMELFSYDRIVALSPAINEIIFALGKGDKIVGNTTYCKFPKTSQEIPKVGGYFSPSLEKILSLKPDIVIMQENNIDLSNKLEKIGINTKVVKIDTIESIKKTIANLGEILDNTNKADEIIVSIDNALASLEGIISDKRILIPIGYNTDLSKEIFVVGQNLYFDDIIKVSGNFNALQSSRKGQPVLNMEKILHINPDIIIILSPLMSEKGLSKEELIKPWKNIPINAAKTDSIYVQTGDYAGIPSDRIIQFIEDFKGFLVETRGK